MERDPADQPDNIVNLLIIDLGEKAIQCANDVWLLFDELETIAEDFPGYFPVFAIGKYGTA